MNSIIEEDCRNIAAHSNLSKLKNKKLLITGATGFLGSYITSVISWANKHKDLGCTMDCVGLGKPHGIFSDLLPDRKINYIRKDLSKPFRIKEHYDFIIHAAGYAQPAKFLKNPFKTVAVNVFATRELLELARCSKASFLFFSSAEIYGEIPQKELPAKETFNGNCSTLTPRAIYAESKRLGETLCSAYRRDFGVDARIIRISHVYGPCLSRSDTRVLSDFIQKALRGKKIQLLDAGRAVKTYGYVADIVIMAFYVLLYASDYIYNVGGKDTLSILDLAKKIGSYCNVPVAVPAESSTLEHIGKDPQFVKLDLTKIRSETKDLTFTPFSQGLRKTIEWSKSEIT
jgi:dTDP-glucose 4,6-dehydratase/UDP-glucuronate decarboxylase